MAAVAICRSLEIFLADGVLILNRIGKAVKNLTAFAPMNSWEGKA
jgi:hypothetical protein